MINAKRAAYQRGEALNKFWSAVLARSQSFEDFLSNMDDEVFDPDGRKWIWRNQLDYLADESGALLVDFIGRTETLNEDFERVRQRLRGETKALLHVNVSAHDHYATYYTPELARLVEDRYARDIDYFGYRFEDWGKSSFPALKQKAKR